MATLSFPIAVTADDQVVWQSSTTWPVSSAVGRNQSNTSQFFGQDWGAASSVYTIQNLLLRWNTSSIPDTAVISSVTLQIYVISIADGAASKNVSGDWTSWTGASDADYSASIGTNAMSSRRINTFTVGQVNSINLDNFGGNVSLTGTTYIRLGSPAPTQTSTDDAVTVANVGSAFQVPTLVINYTLPNTTRMAPDAILSMTNLTGAVTDIDDDPEADDGSWLVAP